MPSPLFGPTQAAATYAALGNSTDPIMGMTEQQLLQQILVAVANLSTGGGGGGGTVTDVSVVTANGVSGSVADSTTTPAITLTLGNITPTRVTIATAGASGVSDLALTGTVFTGGSATTTKPKLLIEPTGTTSTGWNTSGTLLGVNAASGFTGNLLDLQLNGVSAFNVSYTGATKIANDVVFGDPGTTTGLLVKSYVPSFEFKAGGATAVNITAGYVELSSNLGGGTVQLVGGLNSLSVAKGASAQTLNVANTFTSFTDCEFLQMGWDTNMAHLWTIKGSGGGTARSLSLGVDSAANITLNLLNTASVAAALMPGTWFTGGSATSTKPHLLIEPTGTTSTGWSTSGTGIGVNAASGFTGNLIDLQVAASRKFSVDSGGNVSMGASGASIALTINGLFSSGIIRDTENFINGVAIQQNLQMRGDNTFVRFISNTGAVSYGRMMGIATDDIAAVGEAGAMKFSVYGTTDQTNYVRAAVTAGATSITLQAERAGSASNDIDVNILKAGTGNIILSTLPTSDPGVSGALYTTAGAVMQSP